MRSMLLIFVLLLPFAATAQELPAGPVKEQPAASPLASMTASANVDGSISWLEDTGIDLTRIAKTPQQSSAKSQSSKTSRDSKPKYHGSMVGYIDDAIVASQIRIRFDAAFHDNGPDRAEFFYPQCSCINGPGPNQVVLDLNFRQLYVNAEYAPMKRFSFFANVPVRWIEPQMQIPAPNGPLLGNQAGLSDVSAGFKFAAITTFNRYLTFQFQTYFPSGKASRGLGTNQFSVEPELLLYQRLSEKIALEGQIGDSHPVRGSSCPLPCSTSAVSMNLPDVQGFAGDVFFYGLGFSYMLYQRESVRVAPVVELVGWKVLGGFETIQPNSNVDLQQGVSADGTNIVNLKIGARTNMGPHSSFYIGYGHQIAHAVWYKEIVRAEYRYSF